MGASGKEILQQEVDDWAEFEERRNCDIARLRAGHLLGGSSLPPPPPQPQRRTPWVRAVYMLGIPAIAVVLALFPWALSVPPPPDIRAHADEAPNPQVTAPPAKAQREDFYLPQTPVPVVPTAPPATPKPTPVPPARVEQSPPATPAPTVAVAVAPAPTTPTPSPPPPLPSPVTPGVTPQASPAPEASSTPRCLGRVFLLCPPQN